MADQEFGKRWILDAVILGRLYFEALLCLALILSLLIVVFSLFVFAGANVNVGHLFSLTWEFCMTQPNPTMRPNPFPLWDTYFRYPTQHTSIMRPNISSCTVRPNPCRRLAPEQRACGAWLNIRENNSWIFRTCDCSHVALICLF